MFGFEDNVSRQKEKESIKNLNNKVFVDIKALVMSDGKIQPMSLIWNDREYIISKILQNIPARNLKNQLSGYRYKVRIGKKEIYLFYDMEKWYILSK